MTQKTAQKNAHKTALIFGTFYLEKSEFSVQVDHIQEVVNYPEKVIPIPLAPDFLVGIFNLRGTIIPVVNVKRLLKFESTQIEDTHKIAIVDFEGAKVGLVFDSTGEILHVRDEENNPFQYDGNPSSAMKGALKLDGGNRIIQILDPPALLKIDNLPRVLDGIRQENPQIAQKTLARGKRRQCISFVAGKTQFALDIQSIHEIIHVPELQASVIATDNCIGMANLRGEVLPVVDFVQQLGFRSQCPRVPAEERVIVVKNGTTSIGLLIDRVNSIVSFYEEEILPIPLLGKVKSDILEGLISRENLGDMILLSSEKVFIDDEIKSLSEGHRKLFGSSEGRLSDTKKKRSNERSVCIAFQLERAFALPIGKIQEIIYFSDDTIKPPGLPPQIRGVLNLRGQAITIVDMRLLYGLPPFSENSRQKVLIVNYENSKLGLLVDSVEDIITFYEDQKLKIPSAILNGDAFQSEVNEILELPTEIQSDKKKKTLMILDLDGVLGRVHGIFKSKIA